MSTVLEAPEVEAPALDASNVVPRQARPGEPVWELAREFPLQGQWTESDYLRLHFEQHVELSDGCLEFLPMGSYIHEAIANLLAELLRDFTRQHAPGKVLSGRLPIRLWSGQMREPDVVYLTRDRVERLRVPGFESQPDGADLVMEVVSPGEDARERDYVKKRDLYARAGIAEYWIVDPQNETISLLSLSQDEYQTLGEFRRGTIVASRFLPGFAVTVDEVFAAGEPDQPTTAQS